MIPNNRMAVLAICVIGLLIFGCASKPSGQNITGQENATIANPASVFCTQNGGTLRIVTAADGSQNGLCVFPNGSQCEEWAYYRGECAQANQTVVSNQTVSQNVSANVSGLNESDFIVVDDSMPNVFSTEQVAELPPESQ
jgi:putative hemolysin